MEEWLAWVGGRALEATWERPLGESAIGAET